VIVTFDVPGKAAGKARPRVTRGGQHTYTPDPGGFVERVTGYGVAARRNGISSDPIKLTILIDRQMPKSWSQRKRDAMEDEYAPHTPDAVNVAAAICDALQGVYFMDDRQVVSLEVSQVWAYEASTQITVEVLS
jgi:Holliday junction resolvase RusA-like endonuclease